MIIFCASALGDIKPTKSFFFARVGGGVTHNSYRYNAPIAEFTDLAATNNYDLLNLGYDSYSKLFELGLSAADYKVTGHALIIDDDQAGDGDWAESNYTKKIWLYGPHLGIEFDEQMSSSLKIYVMLAMDYYIKSVLSGFNFVPGPSPDFALRNQTRDNGLSNLMSSLTLGIKF